MQSDQRFPHSIQSWGRGGGGLHSESDSTCSESEFHVLKVIYLLQVALAQAHSVTVIHLIRVSEKKRTTARIMPIEHKGERRDGK